MFFLGFPVGTTRYACSGPDVFFRSKPDGPVFQDDHRELAQDQGQQPRLPLRRILHCSHKGLNSQAYSSNIFF